MTDASPGALAPPAGPSAFGAVVGTFASPSATFEGLLKRPTWWLPIVLLALSVGLSFLVMAPKIDVEKSVRDAFEKNAEKTGRTVPPAQVEKVIEMQKKYAWVGAPIAVVFTALVLFLAAGLLLVGVKSMGGEATFAQVLSLYGYSSLPVVARFLVAIPLAFALPNESITQIQAQYVVKSNLGAFLAEDTSPVLHALASSLDVFSIAALVLLIIGFRRIPGLSKGAATALPIVLWVVLTMIGAGFAMMRS